jgi:hypothetical protein
VCAKNMRNISSRLKSKLKIPKTTLTDRAKRHHDTWKSACAAQQVLTPNEEETLLQWAERRGAMGCHNHLQIYAVPSYPSEHHTVTSPTGSHGHHVGILIRRLNPIILFNPTLIHHLNCVIYIFHSYRFF